MQMLGVRDFDLISLLVEQRLFAILSTSFVLKYRLKKINIKFVLERAFFVITEAKVKQWLLFIKPSVK